MRRSAIALVALAAAGAVWFLLAPPLLGGSTSYVIVKGTSMTPRFRGGNLVLLRHRSSYHVGEVVGYRSALLHHVVMHRIVAIKDGRFLFKGDNNDFVDADRPDERDLVGQAWLRIPRVGAAVSWEASPWHAPLVGLLAAALLVGGGAGTGVRRRRRKHRAAVPEGPPVSASAGPRVRLAPPARPLVAAAVAFGVVGVAFATLALVAHARSGTRTVSVPGAYSVDGTFSYASAVRPSAIYPSGRVTTSEPVFLRLVRSVDITFAYRVSSSFPYRLRGVAGMRAVVQNTQGWTRTFELARTRPASTRGEVVGRLHLDRLQQLLASFQRQTGEPESTYTVTVTPLLRFRGDVDGAPVLATVQPSLALAVDSLELRVAPPQTIGTAPPADPLVVRQTGSVSRPAAATFSLLGASPSARAIARDGAIGALAALALALAGGLLARRGRRSAVADESLRIERDYGDRIVDVSDAALARQATVIEVTSIESLAQIAERYDGMILHRRGDGRDEYLLEQQGTLYRYRTTSAPAFTEAEREALSTRA